jgi:hypothetical protein
MAKMMRTLEVVIVIAILTGAFVVMSYFTALPAPRQVSPINLRRLALTTLQTLDSSRDLSEAAFDSGNDLAWNNLQVALSSMLPPDILYNLTIFDVKSDATGTSLYVPVQKLDGTTASISNSPNLGTASDASQYFVASSNVTFNVTPEKIGENGNGGTLYILNCSDANGWWITGYTAQSLAQDLYTLLSPYFSRTIMVESTADLGHILDGTPLNGETLENAVIINTFGEAVPIPSNYAGLYSQNSYAEYFYQVGKRVFQYNWTWTSIVGWPCYYVSNVNTFSTYDNGWGIYGMRQTGNPGLNAFLQGLDNRSSYTPGTSSTSSPGVVYLSSRVLESSNYYGIYPSQYQTSTRALPTSIITDYNLDVTTYVFNPVGGSIPAAVYRHKVTIDGTTQYQGGFYAIGLTRTPDIRITALGLLSEYNPRIYRSEYSVYGTSRLAVLQLGLAGGT